MNWVPGAQPAMHSLALDRRLFERGSFSVDKPAADAADAAAAAADRRELV